MSKVKLVIEIDEDMYLHWLDIKNGTNKFFNKDCLSRTELAVANGTPLPKDFSLEDYERYKKDSESLSWIRYPDRMGN